MTDMKILLVDDSDLIRFRLVRQIACLPGISRVLSASDQAQARFIVEHASPDVVVLDLHLPDGDTVALIPWLKQQAGLQVAILTNDATDYNRQRCLQAGADWFYDKSTEFDQLIEQLHRTTQPPTYRSFR